MIWFDLCAGPGQNESSCVQLNSMSNKSEIKELLLDNKHCQHNIQNRGLYDPLSKGQVDQS